LKKGKTTRWVQNEKEKKKLQLTKN
jgi:hypothetical protein